VVFPGNAAFAKSEIYKALEEFIQNSEVLI
jgi:hypothetical protein